MNKKPSLELTPLADFVIAQIDNNPGGILIEYKSCLKRFVRDQIIPDLAKELAVVEFFCGGGNKVYIHKSLLYSNDAVIEAIQKYLIALGYTVKISEDTTFSLDLQSDYK